MSRSALYRPVSLPRQLRLPPDNRRSRNASFVIADVGNYFPWKPKIRGGKLISSPPVPKSPRLSSQAALSALVDSIGLALICKHRR